MLAHELAHALADQNYNLAKFVTQGRKKRRRVYCASGGDGGPGDVADVGVPGAAERTIAEEQSASWWRMMAKMSDSSGGEYPVFENEPLYLRVTLVFPYTKGMLFQNAVTQRDGKASVRRSVSSGRRFPRSRSCSPKNISPALKPTDPKLPEVKLAARI